jgi:AcrR family transcriptional regulator
MTLEISPSSTIPPRERARHARRQLLLEAAESVFAERGFAGATMAEIASRAGYSAANLYNVFENKEALFGEVIGSSAQLVLDFTRKATHSNDGFEKSLDQLIDAILHFVADHRGFFVILSQSSPEFDWRQPKQEEGARPNVGEMLTRENELLFTRAIERGQILPADPSAYSSIFRGAINSYIARWVREDGTTADLWEDAKDLRLLLKRCAGLRSAVAAA